MGVRVVADTREQIAARVVVDVSWTMDPHGFRIAAVHAAAGVTAGAKAATDRVRQLVSDWQANGSSRTLDDPRAEVWQSCASDLLTLLDRIDAEMGVQR